MIFNCFTTLKFCNFRFVKLDYIPVYSLEQMVETFEREVISHRSLNPLLFSFLLVCRLVRYHPMNHKLATPLDLLNRI